jgi:hypothetical protein
MAEKKTLELAFKKLQGLRDHFLRMEKEVKALKDLLNVHDNWHSEIRSLVGKEIVVCSRTGDQATGELKWSDRYNLCIEISPKQRRIYTKGGIDWIEPRH